MAEVMQLEEVTLDPKSAASIRYDVLDGLHELLEQLDEQVCTLRDEARPPRGLMRDVPLQVKLVRRRLDDLDALGWFSAAQWNAGREVPA